MKDISTTRQFWNANPCDGHEAHDERARFRYAKEPWLPKRLDDLVRRHDIIVEIGCGQGTDGVYLAERLARRGGYVGVDISHISIRNAAASIRARLRGDTGTGSFIVANAQALPFPDNSIECIYSMGVLHHTPAPRAAFAEISRTLKPGGTARIYLYRTLSPKLLAAHALRGVQGVLDRICGSRRLIYSLIAGKHFERRLGTALLECFGVPHLRSYTKSGILDLFKGFEIESIKTFGDNLPRAARGRRPVRPLFPMGVYWEITARKPFSGENSSGNDK